MTAEDLLNKNYEGSSIWEDLHKFRGDIYYENDVITAMQQYAELKCKQLLEIVVKEDRINFSNDKSNDFGIDKNSILNCVDLEKFCF